MSAGNKSTEASRIKGVIEMSTQNIVFLEEPAVLLGRSARPREAPLMSVRRNAPKTASNMLFFRSQICYCGQGCHIPTM